MNKKFEFTFAMTKVDNRNVVFNIVSGSNEYSNAGTGFETISLGNGESFSVYGLTVGDSFTVQETDATLTKDTYVTTITETGQTNLADIDTDNRKISVGTTAKPITKNTAFTVENKKAGTVPTAFFTTYGPYVAGLALLGGLGYAMFEKKKKNG